MSDEYKSLRTIIFEVQAVTPPKPAAPAPQQKPEGTTFEIYGSKDGKEVSIKVKKTRYMGSVVYMVGTSQVELRVAGTGLQVINKKTNRMLLDRGNDMLWD